MQHSPNHRQPQLNVFVLTLGGTSDTFARSWLPQSLVVYCSPRGMSHHHQLARGGQSRTTTWGPRWADSAGICSAMQGYMSGVCCMSPSNIDTGRVTLGLTLGSLTSLGLCLEDEPYVSQSTHNRNFGSSRLCDGLLRSR